MCTNHPQASSPSYKGLIVPLEELQQAAIERAAAIFLSTGY